MDNTNSQDMLWRYEPALVGGRLIRREKRFLAYAHREENQGVDSAREVEAHCPNPGRLPVLSEYGTPIRLLSLPADGRRRMLWRWVQARDLETGAWVGIDTQLPNRISSSLLANPVSGFPWPSMMTIRREVSLMPSVRIDFLVAPANDESQRILVEVKSVSLRYGASVAAFPDSVTSRGARHCRVLGDIAAGRGEAGEAARRLGVSRAALLFVVQRDDCDQLQIAADIDKQYASCLEQAYSCGVEVLAVSVSLRHDGVRASRCLKLGT